MKKIKVDIFIKTYRNDFRWLIYCFKSINKFATNYNKVIVVMPEEDKDLFNSFGFDFPEKMKVFYVKEKGNPYLFQQIVKMSAHKYSKADYIKYLDSDCILNKPFDAHSLIYDGKPEILYRSYLDDFGKNQVDGAICWQLPTSKFLGQRVASEYMCRHIFCYHRTTLSSLEHWLKETRQTTLEEYILSQESFSEFNAIGAWSQIHEPEKYVFVDTNKGWTYVDPQVEQIWSYAKVDGDEGSKKEYARGLKIINRIFDLQLTEI